MYTSWTYYQTESKSDQYGTHFISVKQAAEARGTGCTDAGGSQAGAYRATSSDLNVVTSILKNGGLEWRDGAATKNGVTIECLS